MLQYSLAQILCITNSVKQMEKNLSVKHHRGLHSEDLNFLHSRNIKKRKDKTKGKNENCKYRLIQLPSRERSAPATLMHKNTAATEQEPSHVTFIRLPRKDYLQSRFHRMTLLFQNHYSSKRKCAESYGSKKIEGRRNKV